MATRGDSGRAGSSGRSLEGVPAGRSATPGISDRWSEGEAEGTTPAYELRFLEEDTAAMRIGSPLVGEAAMHFDVEAGGATSARVGARDRGHTGRGARAFGARSSAPKDVREHVQAVVRQNKELVQPSVVRNLIITYSLTVLVVAVLSISGQVAVHVYIRNSGSDALVINVSGRQRMLSQLICKDAVALHFLAEHPSALTPPPSYFAAELRSESSLWEASHAALIHGSTTGIPGLPPLPGTSDGTILELSQQQQPHFDAMVGAVNTILGLTNLTSLMPNTSDYMTITAQTEVLLVNEGPFWELQDSITLQFQQAADAHLNLVLILSWVLHALVIVTLILEGVFVFWPVARSMQRLIDERFNLIRRSLQSEAEGRGVSILMMGYISHELQQPLHNLTQHLDNARDFLLCLERGVSAPSPLGPQAATPIPPTAPAPGPAPGPLAPAAPPPRMSMSMSMSMGSPAVGPLEKEALRGAMAQLEKARLCCDLLSTVSGDITNLRSIELGRMALVVEVVDVADVIQQVLSVLVPKVPAGVHLKVDVAPAIEEEHWRLDRHRLQQILLNLVDNAFRHTAKGIVVVRAKVGRVAGTLRFEVQDSGEGLTEEQRQSLYEPVMDSSGLRQGTANLALYVVRLLVDLQNGKHGVEGAPGGGNLHWVELPAVGGGQAHTRVTAMDSLAEATEHPSARTNTSSGRIVPEND